MPSNCVVRGCRVMGGGFGFPKDPELRLKWRIAIKRENWEPSVHSRVCGDHFVADDFRESIMASCSRNPSGRRLLKKEAVPSVFPWRTDSFDPKLEFKAMDDVPNQASESNNQDDVKEELSSENNLKEEESFIRQECQSESEVTTNNLQKSSTSHGQKPPESVAALNEVKQVFLCRLCHSKFPSRSLWYSHYYECQR